MRKELDWVRNKLYTAKDKAADITVATASATYTSVKDTGANLNDAQRLAREGDWKGAANSGRNGLQSGAALVSGATVTKHLGQAAFENVVPEATRQKYGLDKAANLALNIDLTDPTSWSKQDLDTLRAIKSTNTRAIEEAARNAGNSSVVDHVHGKLSSNSDHAGNFMQGVDFDSNGMRVRVKGGNNAPGWVNGVKTHSNENTTVINESRATFRGFNRSDRQAIHNKLDPIDTTRTNRIEFPIAYSEAFDDILPKWAAELDPPLTDHYEVQQFTKVLMEIVNSDHFTKNGVWYDIGWCSPNVRKAIEHLDTKVVKTYPTGPGLILGIRYWAAQDKWEKLMACAFNDRDHGFGWYKLKGWDGQLYYSMIVDLYPTPSRPAGGPASGGQNAIGHHSGNVWLRADQIPCAKLISWVPDGQRWPTTGLSKNLGDWYFRRYEGDPQSFLLHHMWKHDIKNPSNPIKEVFPGYGKKLKDVLPQ